MGGGKSYTLWSAIFATTGSFIYGYDSGIISTTLGQATFPSYFHHPSDNLTGAIVSSYSGGQGIGNLMGGYLGDALGRKKTIWLASSLALVGAVLQTASVNIEMFIVGRVIAGFAIGLVYAVSSIYNAEIAPPRIRGVIVGLQTQMISMGYASANWIGVFGSFAADTVGVDNAFFYEQEFNQIKQQIDFEREVTIKSFWYLFTVYSNRKRFLLGVLLQVLLQTTGANVVNYYLTSLFAGVGVTGRNVLWLSAGYGMMGVPLKAGGEDCVIRIGNET